MKPYLSWGRDWYLLIGSPSRVVLGMDQGGSQLRLVRIQPSVPHLLRKQYIYLVVCSYFLEIYHSGNDVCIQLFNILEFVQSFCGYHYINDELYFFYDIVCLSVHVQLLSFILYPVFISSVVMILTNKRSRHTNWIP